MKITKTTAIVSLIVLSFAAVIGIHHSSVSAASSTISDPSIGPSSPLYFSDVNGFPTLTSFNGTTALQLVPAQSNVFGGTAWNALNFTGRPVGLSINGTYTQAGGIGVADGFTIVLFARNGTFNSQQIQYANFSIPLFGVSSSTGIQGNLALPQSTSPYLALQWDPFYGSSQFNLWVINPPGSVAHNPGNIGCSIGVPASRHIVQFNATYAPSGNMLLATVADLNSGLSCIFTVGLSQFGFNSPSPGGYWAMVEADNGGGVANWTLLKARILSGSPPIDTDGDGIPDAVELSAAYQALGADPCRKTVAVQIDYMVASDHTHKPLQAAIDKVVAAFDAAPVPATLPCPYAGFPKKPSGINLIVDVKNAIPEQTALNFTGTAPETFDTIKAKFFDPARAPYFHYSLWVHDLAPGSTVSGIGELGGANFIVSLGEWTSHTGTVDEQAGTFMHELGHNLGLDHGGGDKLNLKPNYISVMSYAFQTVGITSLLPNGTITTRFDYSRTALPSLNEAALNETAGIKARNDYTTWRCPATVGGNRTGLGSGPLDWNCNGTIDSNPASVDLNGDGSLETLVGFNDWANLAYRFTNSTNFIHGGHITLPTGKELTFEQAKVIETYWKEFSSLKVSQFFTDSSLNLLPLDSNGNPKVDVVLANGVVRSSNPGQVLAWVNVTNTAGAPVKSLKLTETLPADWVVLPTKITPGTIQVFYVFANGTRLDITTQTSIAVTTGNPETVLLSIANITATSAGTALGTRQGILISAKLAYGLIGTTQSASSYPRKYTDTTTITTFSRALFDGTSVSATGSAFFTAFAKVLGDVNGDFKVDIVDAALLAYSYGAKQGDPLWNPSADFNYDGVIDIQDAAILAFYFGTSS